ncbi:MAG TPA: hypothetical protein VLB84_05960, partial [Bacteroidia bacterium]|nr:hypothetical protein [Bacteroidia bacterium]
MLYGLDDRTRVTVRYTNRYGRKRQYAAAFEGVIPHLLRRHAETESETSREKIEEYMRQVPCRTCDGA